ncbi:hypothetical protein T492DRAFT_842479 [Pavlovales sp. CCMP2436]|nr:hypothetical protein T492DRAFT_842479 [Pavlovales sp. CCMP2436]
MAPARITLTLLCVTWVCPGEGYMATRAARLITHARLHMPSRAVLMREGEPGSQPGSQEEKARGGKEDSGKEKPGSQPGSQPEKPGSQPAEEYDLLRRFLAPRIDDGGLPIADSLVCLSVGRQPPSTTP